MDSPCLTLGNESGVVSGNETLHTSTEDGFFQDKMDQFSITGRMSPRFDKNDYHFDTWLPRANSCYNPDLNGSNFAQIMRLMSNQQILREHIRLLHMKIEELVVKQAKTSCNLLVFIDSCNLYHYKELNG